MKKILIVITTAYTPTGGLTAVMMNYYREIDKTNLQIDFASTNKAPVVLVNELAQNGSRYFCLGKRKNVLQYFIRLYRCCKGYEVIHVNGNSATTVIEHFTAKLAGVKKRINHNHTSIPDHKLLSNMLYPVFNRLVTNKVACSDLAGNWLYGKENFVLLRNAINVGKFQFSLEKRKTIRNSFGIDDTCIVLGHVGKIYKPKNHPYLVKIFAEYRKLNPNTKLLLVGDGVMRQEVENLVDNLNVRENVIFAGLRTDVPEMLQAMDYFVFPSIWEGMPLSVLEALSSGLICVISDSITRDVIIGPNAHSLSIESEPKEWAKYGYEQNMHDRMTSCCIEAEEIKKAGFSIKDEASKLRSIYI